MADETTQLLERFERVLRAGTPAEQLALRRSFVGWLLERLIEVLREKHPYASDRELLIRAAVQTLGRDVAQQLLGEIPDDLMS
jgi:hypothetical protein